MISRGLSILNRILYILSIHDGQIVNHQLST